MNRILTGICAFALVAGGSSVLAAQDKSTAAKSSKEVQQDTKTMTSGKTTKTSTDVVSGKVERYERGKSLTVTVPGKMSSTKSFRSEERRVGKECRSRWSP